MLGKDDVVPLKPLTPQIPCRFFTHSLFAKRKGSVSERAARQWTGPTLGTPVEQRTFHPYWYFGFANSPILSMCARRLETAAPDREISKPDALGHPDELSDCATCTPPARRWFGDSLKRRAGLRRYIWLAGLAYMTTPYSSIR